MKIFFTRTLVVLTLFSLVSIAYAQTGVGKISGKIIDGLFFLESHSEISTRIAPQYKYAFWALLDLGYVFVEGKGLNMGAECDVEPNLMQKEALKEMSINRVKKWNTWDYYSIQ